MDMKENIKLKISLLKHRRRHLRNFIQGPSFGWGACHERRVLMELVNSVNEKIVYLESLLGEQVKEKDTPALIDDLEGGCHPNMDKDF